MGLEGKSPEQLPKSRHQTKEESPWSETIAQTHGDKRDLKKHDSGNNQEEGHDWKKDLRESRAARKLSSDLEAGDVTKFAKDLKEISKTLPKEELKEAREMMLKNMEKLLAFAMSTQIEMPEFLSKLCQNYEKALKNGCITKAELQRVYKLADLNVPS